MPDYLLTTSMYRKALRNGLLVLLAIALALPFLILARAALGAEPPRPVRLGDVTAGSLLLVTEEPGWYLPAPTVATEVTMDASGLVNRVTVMQHFTNPHERWYEGVYLFPLPENAAVDSLRMTIGPLVIEGDIREKEQARRDYEQAKRAGQTASLVEQRRPNMFTTSLANIAPGETVSVEITYQQTLAYRDGAFSLRFPMVVAPRFRMPAESDTVEFRDGGWSAAPARDDSGRPAMDAALRAAVRHPGQGPVNPVALTVRLDAGFPLAKLESPYHAIDVTDEGEGRRTVTLADGTVPANRDFVLRWTPDPGTAPKAGMFAESAGPDDYALVMVMPPLERPGYRIAREAVFVIDTSGSMGGPSIAQARAALTLALDRLTPADRFQVIRFDSETEALFDRPETASAANLARARSWVQGLEADGGTQMMPALRRALGEHGSDDGTERLSQIVFITDGAIGYEASVFGEIARDLGDSRLFTVGIGSAPNAYFMKKAAGFGRGTYTYIGDTAEVGERMDELFARLESPAMTDLVLLWPDGVTAEAWPKRLPDLYYGEPVHFVARLDRDALPDDAEVVISGLWQGREWRQAIPLAGGGAAPGIGKLWARAKIGSLMDLLPQGADEARVREAVLKTALGHHLVSRYTSLVAIDRTPRRPADEEIAAAPVPRNLPDGWVWDKVMGRAIPARLAPRAPADPEQRDAAAAKPAPALAAVGSLRTQQVQAGQGATASELKLLSGLAFLLAGFVLVALLLVRRRLALLAESGR
jgi:Ca-activated chloride channel family protein